ncbi:hypothetical protein ELBI_34 [Anabaena phage Elbi]|nr:hypothetical protein ELBI_34 [Anabaena phage Elbi]
MNNLKKYQKDLTNRFIEALNNQPMMHKKIVMQHLENTISNSPANLIRCNISYVEAEKKTYYTFDNVNYFEYLEFLPGLDEAIKHTLVNGRVPVLISYFPSPEHELVFPLGVESI